jgi:hypothetical protein
MAWKWICISLNSQMVVLMDMVQYCTVSYIRGAQGGSQFFGLSDYLFWCGDITVRFGVGYMAWKWIHISLDSWMVILMDMVQYCRVSYIPGAQGGSQFFGLTIVIVCFGVETSLYKLI